MKVWITTYGDSGPVHCVSDKPGDGQVEREVSAETYQWWIRAQEDYDEAQDEIRRVAESAD